MKKQMNVEMKNFTNVVELYRLCKTPSETGFPWVADCTKEGRENSKSLLFFFRRKSGK